MSETVRCESKNGVARLYIDDGKANALTPDLIGEIGAALDRAEKAKEAVLILGRPGRFSAGFDLGIMRDGGPGAAQALLTAGARLALRLATFPAPVTLACSGHALAMGAVLLTAADLRIGARGDFKIGFNEVAIGMTTPIFLVEFARERLSKRHFLRAVTLAEIYDPDRAADAGLLDRVVEPGELEAEAAAEAERLAQLPRGAFAGSRDRARRAMVEQIEASLEQDIARAFPS